MIVRQIIYAKTTYQIWLKQQNWTKYSQTCIWELFRYKS